jgi:hypothetical protein
VQLRPLQQAAEGPQLCPEAAQLTWLGAHCPWTQRPEQQALEALQLLPSSRQPTTPSPHRPPVQRPLQHWLGPVQLSPSGAQVVPVPQRPPTQLSPAQQGSPNAPPHSWPEPAQVGVISSQRPP